MENTLTAPSKKQLQAQRLVKLDEFFETFSANGPVASAGLVLNGELTLGQLIAFALRLC